MHWHAALFMLPLVPAGAICIALGLLSWRRRTVSGASAFSLLMFTGAFWALSYALELSTGASLIQSQFWNGVKLSFATFLSPFFALFVLQYTRQTWLTTRLVAGVMAIPLLVGICHALVTVQGTLVSGDGRFFESGTLEAGYYTLCGVERAYTLLLTLFVEGLLLREATQAPRLYRQQALVMILGGVIPLAGLFAPFVLEQETSGALPLTFMLAGTGVTWGFIQYRMLDIIPAARDLVVESMSDLVLILDVHNRIVDMNPAAEEGFGLSADEVGGRALETVFREATSLQVDPPEEVEAQAEIILRDGDRPRYLDFRISPLYGWRNLLAGWLIVLRDVTERKLYEEELILAKEQAEIAADMKSALLSNVSHEIRTPLASIIGFAHVVAEEVPPEQKEFIEIIEQNGQRLLNTLNNILDLAQLKSRGITYRPEVFDAVAEVRETVRSLEIMARLKGLPLLVDTPDERVECEMDRSHLSRTLTNLLGNAIKFTETGYVSVQLACDDEALTLIVRDTGIGISESFKPHLFEEFRQESTGNDRSYGGNGLGLAITRHLVGMMGGAISTESRRNAGTTFTVKIPRYAGSSETDKEKLLGEAQKS